MINWKQPMAKLYGQLFLSGKPLCSGPLCNRTVADEAAIFLVRKGVTLAFCGSDCYERACELYLDKRRADQQMQKVGNLLRTLGYAPGQSPPEEEVK